MDAMKWVSSALFMAVVMAACVGDDPEPAGPGAGGCKQTEKPCGGVCVPIDDPRFGCAAASCVPCPASPMTNTTPSCDAAGACGSTCIAGFADCDGDPANGCEVPTEANVAHCGACGNHCGGANTKPNGARCEKSKCVFDCIDGFGHCGPSDASGCDTNITTSTNCGACGHDCRGGTCGERGRCGVVRLSASDLPTGIALDSTYAYFASGGDIRRIRKDNTCAGGPPCDSTWVVNDATGQNVPYALAADGTNVFFAPYDEQNPLPVRRVAANATTPVDIGAEGYATKTGGMTIGAGKLWWTSFRSPTTRVMRANADGSGAAPFVTGTGETTMIVTDGTDVYWVDHDLSTRRIYKMPVGAAPCSVDAVPPAAGACTVLLDLGAMPGLPWGIAIDATNVYFTTASSESAVYRIPKTGGVPAPVATAQDEARTVVTDGAHVYWTNVGDHTVRRVAVSESCAGTSCEVVGTPVFASGLAIDDVAVYFTSESPLASGGGLFMWVK